MLKHAGEFVRLVWGRFKVLRLIFIAGYVAFYLALAVLAMNDIMGWAEAAVVAVGFLGTNLVALAVSFAAFRAVADERDEARKPRLTLDLWPTEPNRGWPVAKAAICNESMLPVRQARIKLRAMTPGIPRMRLPKPIPLEEGFKESVDLDSGDKEPFVVARRQVDDYTRRGQKEDGVLLFPYGGVEGIWITRAGRWLIEVRMQGKDTPFWDGGFTLVVEDDLSFYLTDPTGDVRQFDG